MTTGHLPDDLGARLEAAEVDGRTVRLVQAALAGDRQLADALDGRTPDTSAAAASAGPDHRTAYLRRVWVKGFRGIGAAASLDLRPGPGLTLVVGRNGSGKSSFAEAVELALTGGNARWDSRTKVWRDGWRNLHDGEHAAISAEFALDGVDGTTVTERRWADGAELDDATSSVRGPGGATSLEELGWQEGVELYRPFLPYSELGAMVDTGPTALHDALATVLGLEELTAGAKRLRDARLTRERAWKTAVASGKDLAADLDDLDDDRARAAATQLRSRAPAFGILGDLVADTDTADRSLQLLRELAGIRGPDQDAVRRAAGALEDAVVAAADHDDTDAARALEVADLLGAARRVHDRHGDDDCPVCGAGQLDAAWSSAAQERERELRATAGAVKQAKDALEAARRTVRTLVAPAPGYLERGGAVGVEVAGALRAYETWAAVPRTPEVHRQPGALLTAADDLGAALAGVRDQAGQLLRSREERWRPMALRLASWLDTARPAHDAAAATSELKDAEQALAAVANELRAERWEPIAEQARQIWSSLRQRSSVSVDQVALAGTGTRRRVEVEVTVDGVEGAALGVMSQGELHALALSLFLPRATLPESPFRFVVLDDPVQSMDPARVDGLARVLDAVATERQVVVFTHDDRLPEAVRRHGITARVLEVSRGPASHVSVRETASPWRRHLDDAAALARSSEVPEVVRQTAVPGFCRLALEAACADAYRSDALGSGASHDDVEAALSEASELLPSLALGLFGDAGRAGEVYGHLDRTAGAWATDAVRACDDGSHGGFRGDAGDLVRDVGDLITRALT